MPLLSCCRSRTPTTDDQAKAQPTPGEAPFAEGTFAIPNLAPSLQELAATCQQSPNDGVHFYDSLRLHSAPRWKLGLSPPCFFQDLNAVYVKEGERIPMTRVPELERGDKLVFETERCIDTDVDTQFSPRYRIEIPATEILTPKIQAAGVRHIGDVMLICGHTITLLPWTLYLCGPTGPVSPAIQPSHPPLAKIDRTVETWV